MQTFQLIKDQYTIDIVIDRDAYHEFSFVENGIKNTYRIKTYKPDLIGRTISVEFSKAFSDSGDNILNAYALRYDESSLERYNAFYDLMTFTESSGDFYVKLCINGVMERNLGFKAFNDDGTLIDYSTPAP